MTRGGVESGLRALASTAEARFAELQQQKVQQALEQQADARYEDIGPVVINVRTHYKRPNEQLVACHGFLRGIQIGDKLTGINDIG